MMIWMIDFRAIDAALDLAAHVLKHGLKLPERYNRTAGCLVAEEIATVALAEPDKVTLEQLQRVAALTEEQDMPDQARAKLRSEEHTSELQSLMRNSYDVFCLKKKKHK